MLNVPGGLVIQGNTLYVSNQGSNTVSVYTLNFGTPGTVAGATLARSITGLNIPTGLAFQNGTLFVANAMSGTIGAYGNGAPKTNPSFIIGLTLPAGLAVKSN